MDIERMIDELKEAVMELGAEAVAEVIGYAAPMDDDTGYRLDEALDQMPEDEIGVLYDKYCTKGE